MPYSFTQIDQDKTKTIGFVFSFLILFYFLSGWCIAVIVKNYLILETSSQYADSGQYSLSLLNIEETIITLLIALFIGGIHWLCSVQNLIPKMAKVLGVQPLDPNDSYHQMLKNIIDEVSVATGGKKMEGVVIPTMAMNAFALADFKGNAVIGVTEGLLSRLSRAQIEAVVGHEAAHVVSGDCLSTTVTTSIFALYNGLLNGLSQVMRGGQYSSRRRGGGFLALILVIYLVLSVTRLLSLLARMFISREREFRADAVSVRLTRDPLSLAEALYAISHRWRGAGLTGEDLEAIFIINPKFSFLDEQNNLFADLFSTHPPVEKRLGVLLDMAKTDVQSLEENFQKNLNKPKQSIPEPSDAISQTWMVQQGGQWSGPFNFEQLLTVGGLTPETWVKKTGGSVKHAYEDEIVQGIFQKNEQGTGGDIQCPRCHVPLGQIFYEGVPVLKCLHCGGVMAMPDDIQRIIIREDMGFPERIEHMAQMIEQGRVPRVEKGDISLRTANVMPCPNCRNRQIRLLRMFYTMAYPVEVDKCTNCGCIWFDKDELEVLQYLIEKKAKEQLN